MNIALIAHDAKKELLVQFCIAYCGISADTMFALQEQQASSFQKQQVLKSIAFLQEARAADSRLQAALPAMRLTF